VKNDYIVYLSISDCGRLDVTKRPPRNQNNKVFGVVKRTLHNGRVIMKLYELLALQGVTE
jgi:hypothetical protein